MSTNRKVIFIPNVAFILLFATSLFSSDAFQVPQNSNQTPGARKAPVTVGTKVTLSALDYPNAKCLDGTQGAYYYSPGSDSGLDNWYIFRQGGGFCSDVEDCLRRSRTNLGSSSEIHGWKSQLAMDGVDEDPHMGFSRDVKDNPLMHNWNYVFVIYCDGAYYAGNNMTATMTGVFGLTEIHFKGAHITSGLLQDLKRYNFQNAKNIVVGGCSAGGISTITTIDWVKSLIVKIAPTAKLAGFSCSGFFLDYDYSFSKYTTKKYFPYHHSNVSGSLHPQCLSTYVDLPHKCLVSHVGATFASVPMFFWESLYDSYMLAHVLQHPCDTAECANPHGNNIRAALYNLWHMRSTFGGYLSGCSHHCEGSAIGSIMNLRPVDGITPLQAMHAWYTGHVLPRSSTAKQRYWQEIEPYPCIACCPPKTGLKHHHPIDDYYE